MSKKTCVADEVVIKVRENGPYLVRGPITLTDADGNPFALEGDNVALCRCGQSANKPFCDGSHKTAGFAAAGRANVTAEVTG